MLYILYSIGKTKKRYFLCDESAWSRATKKNGPDGAKLKKNALRVIFSIFVKFSKISIYSSKFVVFFLLKRKDYNFFFHLWKRKYGSLPLKRERVHEFFLGNGIFKLVIVRIGCLLSSWIGALETDYGWPGICK